MQCLQACLACGSPPWSSAPIRSSPAGQKARRDVASPRHTRNLSVPPVHRVRRHDELWWQHLLSPSSRRSLHHTDSQRREARRSAGTVIHEGGADFQSQEREGARPHRPALLARPRRRGDRVKRRSFIAGLGINAILPLAARAQQTMPVIGFLNGATAKGYARMLKSFRQGLKEAGYTAEAGTSRWSTAQAEGHYDRLPELVADLVRRQVSVIAATSTPANLVARKATSTIPIVFTTSSDPVQLGLVRSLKSTRRQRHRRHPVECRSRSQTT